ncbi:MAG: histone deacetylase family protein [Halanaeroarchaeum sp.]
MRFGFSETCLDHDPGPRHPENPDRLRAIRERLRDGSGVEYVEPEPARERVVGAVHSESYLEELRQFVADGGGNWDPDTVATETTWDAAMTAAGIATWVVDEALAGATGHETPFSLGRPPGHHATRDEAMGFCFFNNVAVGAQHAIDEGAVDRVAIVDWDVHHGNGTQDIFYDRGDVFYVSLHEDGLYPGTGQVDEVGDGAGVGTTLNVPLPAGSGDVEYVAAIQDVIGPALRDFDPGLLLISAGFDAHRHDPISRMHVSTEGYGLLTERVRDLAADVGAGLGFVLEGGYGLDTLAEGVAIVNEVFEGRSVEGPSNSLQSDVEDLLDDVRRARQGAGSK